MPHIQQGKTIAPKTVNDLIHCDGVSRGEAPGIEAIPKERCTSSESSAGCEFIVLYTFNFMIGLDFMYFLFYMLLSRTSRLSSSMRCAATLFCPLKKNCQGPAILLLIVHSYYINKNSTMHITIMEIYVPYFYSVQRSRSPPTTC